MARRKVIRRKIIMPKPRVGSVVRKPKPGEMDYQAVKGAAGRKKATQKILDRL